MIVALAYSAAAGFVMCALGAAASLLASTEPAKVIVWCTVSGAGSLCAGLVYR